MKSRPGGAAGLCLIFLAVVATAGCAEVHRLESASMRAAVIVGDEEVGGMTWLSELYFRTDGAGGSGWTANMVFNYTAAAEQMLIRNAGRLSGTALVTRGSDGSAEWSIPVGGSATVTALPGGARLTITDIQQGPWCTEAWELVVAGGKMDWRVERTFHRDVELLCDRSPALVLNTEYTANLYQPKTQSQIWSLLDPEFEWNDDGNGFACDISGTPVHAGRGVGSGPAEGRWVYGVASRLSQPLLLSPAMMEVRSEARGARVVMAWPTKPGTGGGDTTMSVGVQAAPHRGENRLIAAAGSSTGSSWSLDIAGPSRGLAEFTLSIPSDPATARTASELATTFNMWAGSIIGNSPASCVCLHEMSWFPLTQSIFAGAGGRDASTLDALEAELDMFGRHGVQENGFVYARWSQDRYINMTIHDQQPHFILAFYYHAVNTGRKGFIHRSWPVLERVAGYILNEMRMEETGIATTPTASGLPGSDHADNWFDIVNFGHNDAIINAYACQAMKAMSMLAEWIGLPGRARYYSGVHSKATAAYNALFYNGETGLYSDWQDSAGTLRNYGYLWHQFLAIDPLSGLATPEVGERILRTLDENMDRIRREHGVSEERLWCLPTNLFGIAPADGYQNGTLQNQKEYGNYENGACFVAFSGMGLAARRAQPGGSDRAWSDFVKYLGVFKRTRFWGQHYEWVNSDEYGFNGSDVLTDTLLVLQGALRAGFAIRTDLSGVHPDGTPAKALEGASHTFVHLGRLVTVTVKAGKTIVDTQYGSANSIRGTGTVTWI